MLAGEGRVISKLYDFCVGLKDNWEEELFLTRRGRAQTWQLGQSRL